MCLKFFRLEAGCAYELYAYKKKTCISSFLDAFLHLYKRVFPSIGHARVVFLSRLMSLDSVCNTVAVTVDVTVFMFVDENDPFYRK